MASCPLSIARPYTTHRSVDNTSIYASVPTRTTPKLRRPHVGYACQAKYVSGLFRIRYILSWEKKHEVRFCPIESVAI